VPKSKSGKTKADPARDAANARYIARAARVMRLLMVLAILATVATLYFMVEPVARMAIHGDLGRTLEEKAEYRRELVQNGEIPPPLIDPNWQKWGLTVGGGLFMLVLFGGLYRALRRMEQPVEPNPRR
jgi:hypothetical protein